jgi:hypothetical protein
VNTTESFKPGLGEIMSLTAMVCRSSRKLGISGL